MNKEAISSPIHTMDIQNLPNGTYIIKVHTDEGIIIDKFVKLL